LQTSRMKRADAESLGLRRQPFYCEENVWQLCQEPRFAHRPREVVFVSNPARALPMWHQRAARGRPIVWDYHVLLLARDPCEIWDVDTLLGVPVPALEYLGESFHPGVPAEMRPLFRLVPAEIFTATFASDRSHMRRPDGSFEKPPPPWPAIGAPGAPSNLLAFVEMEQPFLGEVLSLAELTARIG
jgi:protein N-terminal glutamine amidohydrolase